MTAVLLVTVLATAGLQGPPTAQPHARGELTAVPDSPGGPVGDLITGFS